MKRVAMSNFKEHDPLRWIARDKKNYFEEHNVGVEPKTLSLSCSRTGLTKGLVRMSAPVLELEHGKQ